jgi:hypothetical protein
MGSVTESGGDLKKHFLNLDLDHDLNLVLSNILHRREEQDQDRD